jgi:hypothetical protein
MTKNATPPRLTATTTARHQRFRLKRPWLCESAISALLRVPPACSYGDESGAIGGTHTAPETRDECGIVGGHRPPLQLEITQTRRSIVKNYAGHHTSRTSLETLFLTRFVIAHCPRFPRFQILSPISSVITFSLASAPGSSAR